MCNILFAIYFYKDKKIWQKNNNYGYTKTHGHNLKSNKTNL